MRAEDLHGERGIALLGEVLVLQEGVGAEDDGVAAAGRGQPQQGEVARGVGVALVGVPRGRRISAAAHFCGAGSAGGGQVAPGLEDVDGDGPRGADARGEPSDGGLAGGEEDDTAARPLHRVMHRVLLTLRQQVGHGDEDGGVGSGGGHGLVRGGDDRGGHTLVVEELSDGPAAGRVGRTGVECVMVLTGTHGGVQDAEDDQDEERHEQGARARPQLARGRGGRRGGRRGCLGRGQGVGHGREPPAAAPLSANRGLVPCTSASSSRRAA